MMAAEMISKPPLKPYNPRAMESSYIKCTEPSYQASLTISNVET
jgi:hypothetical protein